MKNHDFINSNIGNQVYVTGDGDLAMCSEPRNVREISELDKSKIEYDCTAQFCIADCVPCFLCEFSIKKNNL